MSYCADGPTLEQVAREVVKPPSLEVLETQLNMALSNLLTLL